MLVKFDHENKKVRLLLCGEEVLQTLQDKGEKINPKWVAVSSLFFYPPLDTDDAVQNFLNLS